MVDASASPAVALLFADQDLSVHLREALLSLGARIVHEGPASDVRRQTLLDSGAEVVVVNLEPEEEDSLADLYEALDEDEQRVVFNDAEATRDLSGWDKARWARHLAAKLVGSNDVDPPRPEGAREVNVQVRPHQSPSDAPVDVPVDAGLMMADVPPVSERSEPAIASRETSDVAGSGFSDESEDLAVELEALLAEENVTIDNDDMDEEIGSFAQPLAAEEQDLADAADPDVSGMDPDQITTDDLGGMWADEPALASDSRDRSMPDEISPTDSGPAEELESAHSDADLELPPEMNADSVEPGVETDQGAPAPATVDEWGLVDFDAAPPAPPPSTTTDESEAEPVESADNPAANDDSDGGTSASSLDLELVALDEENPSRATDEPVSEMMLDAGVGQIHHVVVLGAGSAATSRIADFLSALPAALQTLILVVQHQDDQRADVLAEVLNESVSVRVQVAGESPVMARQGQVWFIPSGYCCQLGHGGRLSLIPDGDGAAARPSIDHCLGSVAEVFGREMTAIILAGDGFDAVAGIEKVSARGGKVWIQGPDMCGEQSMAKAIDDTGLAVFSGSPEELARQLCEEHA